MKPFRDDLTPVRHGYTVSDVWHLAHTEVRMAAARGAWDLEEKLGAAVAEAVLILCESELDPGLSALCRGIRRAVSRERYEDGRSRGIRDGQPILGFFAYWHCGHVRMGLEDFVVEGLAVSQVLAGLTERQRQVLLTYRDCGEDATAAGALLGIKNFYNSLYKARQAFAELWHQHETPAKVSRAKGRVFSSEQDRQCQVEVGRAAARRLNGEPASPKDLPRVR
jgi:hypothetical protein